MQQEIQDERYYVADEAICDAFFLVLKEKDLEKWGISRPKTSNLKTIESGILEQFDKEMER